MESAIGICVGVLVLFFIMIVAILSNDDKEKERQAALQAEEQKRLAMLEEIKSTLDDDTYQRILNKRITIGMSKQQVLLSWGTPTKIDNTEISEKGGSKQRWVYGIAKPGRPASYVFFKDDNIVKIKN